MKIAGIDIDDKNLIEFSFQGVEPNIMTNISQDGSNRDSVLISNAYKYNMLIGGIDKQLFEKIFAELTTLSNQYKKVTIDMNSVLRSETPDMTLLDTTAIDFEFDLARVKTTNRGGFYDITMQLTFIEYF